MMETDPDCADEVQPDDSSGLPHASGSDQTIAVDENCPGLKSRTKAIDVEALASGIEGGVPVYVMLPLDTVGDFLVGIC